MGFEPLMNVYNFLRNNHNGFTLDYNTFKSDMQDEGNLQRLHSSLGQIHPPFQVDYPTFATDMGVTPQQPHYVKNNLFNRAFDRKNILENQILNENQALRNVAPLRKFHVDYANPEDEATLKNLHHNPEYISPDEGVEEYKTPRGEVVKKGRMQVTGDDEPLQTIKVNHPKQYTTVINPNDLRGMTAKDAASLDFTGHALHKDPIYNGLTDKLKTALYQKHGAEHIENEGGVDAYVRGLQTGDDNKEYSSYRDELKAVDPKLVDNIRQYIKTGKLK